MDYKPKKKKIEEKLDSLDKYFFDGTFEEAIKKLNDILLEYTEKGYTNLRIDERTEEGYYNDVSVYFDVYGTREETDKEYEARLIKQKKDKEYQKER